MSSPIPYPDQKHVLYTVGDFENAIGQILKSVASQRKQHIRFFGAAMKVVGRPFDQWAHKANFGGVSVPVADPGIFNHTGEINPTFRRENTFRSLGRFQSFRVGLGFRAQKVSEQRLLEIETSHQPDAGDSYSQKFLKFLRRNAARGALRNPLNISISGLMQKVALHNKGLQAAQKSFGDRFKLYNRNNPRLRELTETLAVCQTTLSELGALKFDGFTHFEIPVNRKDLRRLLIESPKLPFHGTSLVLEMRDYLTSDAKILGLKQPVADAQTVVGEPPKVRSGPARPARSGAAQSVKLTK
ncbi:MAG: hypothetical protein ABTQ34_05605 [Bdellovibrionales bacterium]